MSSDLKADLEVSIDADKFDKGSDKIQKGFDEIDKSASKSMGGVEDSLSGVGQEAERTGDKVRQAGEKGSQGMEKFEQSTDKAKGGVSSLSFELFGLADGFSSVNEQMLAFAEKSVTIERNTLSLQKTQIDNQRQIEDFIISLNSGEFSSLEYARAIEDITLAEKDAAIETRELSTEISAISGEYVGFAISLSQTVAFSILTVNSLLNKNQKLWLADQKAMLATRAQTILLSKTFKTLIFDINGFSAALVRGNGSLALLKSGVRAFFTSLGPIGIAIIGVSVAMELWNSNIGNVQQHFEELWKTIENFFPILKTLGLLVENLFPQEAHADVQEYSTSIEELTSQFEAGEISAEEFALALEGIKTTTDESTDSIGMYGNALGHANDRTGELNDSTTSLGKTMVGVPDWYGKATASVREFKKEVSESEQANLNWIKTMEEASRKRFLGNEILGGITPIIDPVTGEITSGQNGIFDKDGNRISSSPSFSGGLSVGIKGTGTHKFTQDPSRLGTKSGSATNRAGGHSPLRQDRLGGQINGFLTFQAPQRFGSFSDAAVGFINSKIRPNNLNHAGDGKVFGANLKGLFTNTVAEADSLAASFSQLIGVDPTVANFTNAHQLLKQQNQFIQQNISSTGLSEDAVRNLLSLGQQKTLADIARYNTRTEKELLISTTV